MVKTGPRFLPGAVHKLTPSCLKKIARPDMLSKYAKTRKWYHRTLLDSIVYVYVFFQVLLYLCGQRHEDGHGLHSLVFFFSSILHDCILFVGVASFPYTEIVPQNCAFPVTSSIMDGIGQSQISTCNKIKSNILNIYVSHMFVLDSHTGFFVCQLQKTVWLHNWFATYFQYIGFYLRHTKEPHVESRARSVCCRPSPYSAWTER